MFVNNKRDITPVKHTYSLCATENRFCANYTGVWRNCIFPRHCLSMCLQRLDRLRAGCFSSIFIRRWRWKMIAKLVLVPIGETRRWRDNICRLKVKFTVLPAAIGGSITSSALRSVTPYTHYGNSACVQLTCRFPAGSCSSEHAAWPLNFITTVIRY